MPSQDQQPEEATTRPLAAAASFAGSVAQTTIYGRGMQQRANTAANKQTRQQETAEQKQPEHTGATAAQQAGVQPEPAPDAAAQPVELPNETAAADGEAAKHEVGEPVGSAPSVAGTAEPADVAVAEPAVSGQMLVEASARDAAAAQARMARSQLPEPPSVAPPAPGLGPAL